MLETINQKSILYRQIQGGLKCTIKAHGPIHRKCVSSATKRILGHLSKIEKISFPDEPLKERLLILMSEYHRRLFLLREKLKSKDIAGGTKANIAGKTQEIRRILLDLNNLLTSFGQDAKSIDDIQLDQKL